MRFTRSIFVSMCLFCTGLALPACGSDDDGGGSAAKLASCKQVCDKSAPCPSPIQISVADCKTLCDAFAQAPAACQDALKAQSDCQLAAADICNVTGCDAQETAVGTACK
jgi:hypothetical protein